MINSTKILMTILVFIFCSGFVSTHVKYADKLLNAYAKQMKYEKGFELSSIGGAMMKNVKSVTLDLSDNKNVDIAEARKLYVETAEGLILKINDDVKIRPYLNQYPFTIENIEVSISFHEPDEEFVDPQYVSHVFYA